MGMELFNYEDSLKELDSNIPLREKLTHTHKILKARFDFIDRIAVALYDPKTDQVKTFIDSSHGGMPLKHYQIKLSEVNSLREIIEHRKPRVVNDLGIFSSGDGRHTLRIQQDGYISSYTMPMFSHGMLFGFLFFNSRKEGCFIPETLGTLDVFGHLISLVIINEITSLRTLLATVKTARDVSKQRDVETGAHLDRMAHYAQIIALELAKSHDLNDEFVEHVFLFAPLHDIGKIGVPDRILLKPGKLSDGEYEEMKLHVEKGRQLIDEMLKDFGLEDFPQIGILRNIVLYHHEAMDGTGYLYGLEGNKIPLESRIIAVADVFDALTSKRPYKEAWSNDQTFAHLEALAGKILDPECVAALVKNRVAVEEMQAKFPEDPFG